MENILELVKKYMTEIEDDESLLLYRELIISHPHYHIIQNLPCKYLYTPVSIAIYDKYCIRLNSESEYFKDWFNTLQTQYSNIINGKHT